MHNLDEVCNAKYDNTANVLTKYKLSNMIDPSKTKTYVYVPESYTGLGQERVYNSAGNYHAEDLMLTALTSPPKEFWITNSPCPVCARKLMLAFAGSSSKAEINIRKFYKPPPGNGAAISGAVDCLAKMMHQGFKFYDWDWPAFYKEFLKGGNKNCINVLINASKNEEKYNILKKQYKQLRTVLVEATRRSKNQQWIRDVTKKCLA